MTGLVTVRTALLLLAAVVALGAAPGEVEVASAAPGQAKRAAPTVRWLTPKPGASVRGRLGTRTCRVGVRGDNARGVRVEFFAGRARIGVDRRAPFTCRWRPTTTRRNVTLRAVVIASGTARRAARVRVHVDRPAAPTRPPATPTATTPSAATAPPTEPPAILTAAPAIVPAPSTPTAPTAPPPSPATPGVDAVSHRFASSAIAPGFAGYGTYSASGGRGQFTPTRAGSYSGAVDLTERTLIGRRVFVQVPSLPTGAASVQTFLGVQRDEDNQVQIMATSNTHLGFYVEVAGTASETSVPYDANAHAWWALREANGQVIFETMTGTRFRPDT